MMGMGSSKLSKSKSDWVPNERSGSLDLGLGLMLIATMMLFEKATLISSYFVIKVLLAALIVEVIRLEERFKRLQTLVKLVLISGSIWLLGCGLLVGTQIMKWPLIHGVPHMPVARTLYDIAVFDGVVFGREGLSGFLMEAYQYATVATKLSFYHSEYALLLLVLVIGKLLNLGVRSRWRGFWMILPTLATAGLWFTYLDVWTSFSLYFMGYVLYRFSVSGKSFLFGILLPALIPVAALAALAMTPVKAINETLQPWIQESNILRTDLGYSLNTGDFNLGKFGFYPLKDRLGGPIQLDKQLMFRVETETPLIYLRGRVLDTYNGRAWNSQVDDKEPLKQFYRVSPQALKTFSYTIKDIQFKSNIVLAPAMVTDISIETQKLRLKPGNVLAATDFISKVAPKGYSVTGYPSAYGIGVSLEPYLQVPTGYSRVVKGLTERLIQGAATPTERMERIKTYLLTHYNYTLATSRPPENIDFVEYFLTKESGGYCTYFASATAVMGRIAGVPTRYVEGFLTPKQIPIGRAVPVTGERAHAWVEAWLDNRWQIIESTPAYVAEALAENETMPERAVVPLPEFNQAQTDRSKDDGVTIATATGVRIDWRLTGGLGVLVAGSLGVFIVLRIGYRRFFEHGTSMERSKRLADSWLSLLIDHYHLTDHDTMTFREVLRQCDASNSHFGYLGLIEFAEKSLYDSKGAEGELYEAALAKHVEFVKTELSLLGKLSHIWDRAWRGIQIDGNDRKASATKYRS